MAVPEESDEIETGELARASAERERRRLAAFSELSALATTAVPPRAPTT